MKKGILNIIEGDATNPKLEEKEIAIIPHVCNHIGAWGAGFVLALSKKWDYPEKHYKQYISETDEHLRMGNLGSPLNTYEIRFKEDMKSYRSFFGHSRLSQVANNVFVANMIAQKGVTSKERRIKYNHLVKAMECVRDSIAHMENRSRSFTKLKFSIHCPKFGSDLAGGNFHFILELIKDIWIESGIDVTVYEFVEK
jgi:hypothetical protein